MYKYQLQKWGARKNLTVSFLHELDSGAESHAESSGEQRRMLFRGREINKAELQSYVIRRARRNKWNRVIFGGSKDSNPWTEESSSDSAAIVPSPTGFLRINDEIYNFEKVFFSFKSYAEDAFSHWAWLNDGAAGLSPYTKLDLWTLQIASVTDLLRNGKTQQAFRVLEVCHQQCSDLIRTGEPRLVVRLFRAIMPLLNQHDEAVRLFLRYTGALATILHGPLHPLRHVSEVWHGMDQRAIIQQAAPLLESYYTFLQRQIPKSTNYNLIIDCALREIEKVSTAYRKPADDSADLAAVSWLGGDYYQMADTLAAYPIRQTELPLLPVSTEEAERGNEAEEGVEVPEQEGQDEDAKCNDDGPAAAEQRLDLPPLVRMFNAGRQWFDSILYLATAPEPRPGYSRLQYSCRCGLDLYDDYTESRPGALDTFRLLLRQQGFQLTTPGDLESNKAGGAPSSSSDTGHNAETQKRHGVWLPVHWQKQANKLKLLLRQQGLKVATSGDLESNKPGEVSPSSSETGQSPEIQKRHGVRWSVHWQEQAGPNLGKCQRKPAEAQNGDKHNFILVCIPFGRSIHKLHQPEVCTLGSDEDFFSLLQSTYREYRTKSSLSFVRRIKSVHFAHLEVYRTDLADIRSHPALPPSSMSHQYKYEPMPSDFMPPIGSNLLVHLLENPTHAGALPHLYKRVPQKLQDKLSPCVQKGTSVGWGLALVEGIDYFVFFLCGCAGFLVSLLVALAWTLGKDDIQGGFGIGGFLLSFMVFCGGLVHSYITTRTSNVA